ncbi:FKBP-type peptidyl-prolyl cis-trans isomerase [Belliella pelovolcani]|uniref:FKBP-type peptidyl-prolyl cis-trans isomerase n=1 Tax=Belliella pelovolcani TaxID=529505 RepID=UPI00391D279A
MRNLFYFIISVFILASCDDPARLTGGPVYDFEGNMATDRVKIDDYISNTPIDSLYRIHDPSGVVIIVQEEGAGTRPSTNNVVYTDYTGSLLDGSVFDTSIRAVAEANDIFDESRTYSVLTFTLYPIGGTGQVIQGWNYAFRRLRPGSKAVMLIPSPLGYRDSKSNEKIPPNSVLRFDVDFKGID